MKISLSFDGKKAVAYNFYTKSGEVLELADRRDLGSRAETRESSSLSFPISIRLKWAFFVLTLLERVKAPFSLENVLICSKII
jgi:hypothetical protein